MENSRAPEAIERVLARLVEWRGAPEQAPLRRAFVVWLKRVLLPARAPGVDIPHIIELQGIHAMLAEPVKTWTEGWKQQGIEQGIHRGEATVHRRLMTPRFGPLPSWVDQCLEQASPVQLESWPERVLDCQTLENMFNGSP